jgi:hypothetical protein
MRDRIGINLTVTFGLKYIAKEGHGQRLSCVEQRNKVRLYINFAVAVCDK